MFIGREAELKFLQDKYDEKKGQLIVLYGRRRVGKPSESFADKSHISFFPAHKARTGYSLQNFQNKFCGRIYTQRSIFPNLQIGKRLSVQFSICLTVIKRN